MKDIVRKRGLACKQSARAITGGAAEKKRTAVTDTAAATWSNMLIFGDNVTGLETLLEKRRRGGLKSSDNSDGVRLVYIDPPFASGARFSAECGGHAYGDKRKGAEFLAFMRARLMLLRELLSEDGSIYLHID